MVLERHIQQFSHEDMQDLKNQELIREVSSSDKNNPPTDQELLERLEALPKEKKEALLELLD